MSDRTDPRPGERPEAPSRIDLPMQWSPTIRWILSTMRRGESGGDAPHGVGHSPEQVVGDPGRAVLDGVVAPAFARVGLSVPDAGPSGVADRSALDPVLLVQRYVADVVRWRARGCAGGRGLDANALRSAADDLVLETLLARRATAGAPLPGAVERALRRLLWRRTLAPRFVKHRVGPRELVRAGLVAEASGDWIARIFLESRLARSALLHARLRAPVHPVSVAAVDPDTHGPLGLVHLMASQLVYRWHRAVDPVGAGVALGLRALVRDGLERTGVRIEHGRGSELAALQGGTFVLDPAPPGTGSADVHAADDVQRVLVEEAAAGRIDGMLAGPRHARAAWHDLLLAFARRAPGLAAGIPVRDVTAAVARALRKRSRPLDGTSVELRSLAGSPGGDRVLEWLREVADSDPGRRRATLQRLGRAMRREVFRLTGARDRRARLRTIVRIVLGRIEVALAAPRLAERLSRERLAGERSVDLYAVLAEALPDRDGLREELGRLGFGTPSDETMRMDLKALGSCLLVALA